MGRNWKCHVIIVIKTDVSGFIVTMHSGLCEQYVKSLGRMPSGFDFLFRTRPRGLGQQTPPEPVLIPWTYHCRALFTILKRFDDWYISSGNEITRDLNIKIILYWYAILQQSLQSSPYWWNGYAAKILFTKVSVWLRAFLVYTYLWS